MDNASTNSASKGRTLKHQALVYMHEEFKAKNKSFKNNWVWYSRSDIQNILNAIDNLPAGDGVRLYHGVYDKAVCDYLNTLTSTQDYNNHIGHNTVFFVPTYKGSEADEHIDNISAAEADMDRADRNAGKPIPQSFDGGEGYNLGTICPPPTPPKTECGKKGNNL
ncbi:MAG: hypothetical protein JSU03_01010 [Bacteroidetes bacterium]|nr:hypothetical protein [Bacteroidota bacterium]MBS1755832.1 hypothetical protein [Bacteroidota bacterium]